jgi:hypothetical protein
MQQMNTKKMVLSAVLGLGMMGLGSMAQAQTESTGFLADYGYQVANLTSMRQAQSLMDTETRDTAKSSICANRADVWSYVMNRDRNVQVGKVFIHFTKDGEATENKQWAYHVAPFVYVNGQPMVLDNGFDVFNHQPVPLAQWENYFGKSDHCVALDPLHNPAHMALEQNNLPNDHVNPLTYTRGGARQYPSTEGICYIRKVPMYYVYPIDVYGADLALSGQSQFSSFLLNDFNKDDVLSACRQALTLSARISTSCASYLGIVSGN